MNGKKGGNEAIFNQESLDVLNAFFGKLMHNLRMCGATKNETKAIFSKVLEELENKTYDPETKAETLLKIHRLRRTTMPVSAGTGKLVMV